MVTNSTFASSVPSGAASFIAEDFGVTSSYLLTLLISFFLLGYVVGPVMLAPISEYYGRRMVTIVAFGIFFIFSLASAASPNFASLLVFRFLTGLGASAPLSITGGQFADIWQDAVSRGRCKFMFSLMLFLP
jgi:MFS family permease